MDRFELTLCGETFFALSAKALWWPAQETVFVADIHLGKAASFRARSLPIPRGTTAAALLRLSGLLNSTEAKRMVVLGDLWHDSLGRSEPLNQALYDWTRTHQSVEFSLITGNHDRKSGATGAETGFTERDELCIGPFCCLHHPVPRAGNYVLCGHIHPGFGFAAARVGVRLPCFWFRPDLAVLPAFGEFTGLTTIAPDPEDRIVLIAEDQVVPLNSACLQSGI